MRFGGRGGNIRKGYWMMISSRLIKVGNKRTYRFSRTSINHTKSLYLLATGPSPLFCPLHQYTIFKESSKTHITFYPIFLQKPPFLLRYEGYRYPFLILPPSVFSGVRHGISGSESAVIRTIGRAFIDSSVPGVVPRGSSSNSSHTR